MPTPVRCRVRRARRSACRCSAQATAKPVFRMPPGYSVEAVASIVESGEIASRAGGSSCDTNSWLIAPYEMPIIPTLWSRTHGWLAIVSMTSYPSRFWSGSKKLKAPPEQPGPTHVDVDDREAHEIREDGDPVLRSSRIRVPVARVFDERRVRRKVVGRACSAGECQAAIQARRQGPSAGAHRWRASSRRGW